jgi:murein DD-endopeptidase MepM/ murein hydrolase activator NlpD
MWPVHGKVTLEFGQPDPPYEISHTGIDIAVPIGTPVKAFMAGIVIYSGETTTGYGVHVILQNTPDVTSLYGHLSQLLVTQGQQVQEGQVIGLSGSTGWSTGPHLHFEIDVFNIPTNPRTFLSYNP